MSAIRPAVDGVYEGVPAQEPADAPEVEVVEAVDDVVVDVTEVVEDEA